MHGLCRDDDLTDDVVAGTYLRAWRSARSYRTGTNTYRRWLLRIARNQLTDYWRADRHTVPLGDMDFPQAEEPDGSLAAEDRGREVARLMESLTLEQREVVVLRYMNNLSFREIADLLGKREGAVRSQLLRALRHMRKVMHDASS